MKKNIHAAHAPHPKSISPTYNTSNEAALPEIIKGLNSLKHKIVFLQSISILLLLLIHKSDKIENSLFHIFHTCEVPKRGEWK